MLQCLISRWHSLQVLSARFDQIVDDSAAAIGDGDILQFSDLLDWDAPAFDCPVDTEQVVMFTKQFSSDARTFLQCPGM